MNKCRLIFLIMLSRTGRAFVIPAVAKQMRLGATTTTTTSTKFFSSTSTTPQSSPSQSSSMKDNSAMSKSRPSFRMPKNSPDDSKAAQVSSKTLTSSKDNKNNNALTWNPLGLYTQVVDCLEQDLKLAAPTPIQSMVIPELLSRPRDSFAFLAATGSGKTLAYLLPLMQQLKHQEDFESYERRPRRPRVLILAPTRELVSQITGVLKTVSHSFKVSSLALVGGQQKGQQAKSLSREVDIVVATPGRLLQHWKDGNIFFGQVDSIVLDEMDTMLEQGFQQELRSILYPLLYPGGKAPKDIVGGLPVPPSATQFKDSAPRIILTSATMTQMVQKSLGDNPKTSKLTVTAKKNFVKKRGENDKDPQHKQQQRAGEQPPQTATTLKLPPMKIISAPGLHRTVPRLDQVFVDVGSTDKISLLVDVVSSQARKRKGELGATIIFCNTATSVRAVQFALAEARIESLSYHGELNSAVRTENLKRFQQGASGKTSAPSTTSITGIQGQEHQGTSGEPITVLVCTDLAARGLDIPAVDHVVMFDFPLNALDYLHRSGRTARGDRKGRVTALVAKRDKVLATAIEQAVTKGEALDGLSSRKSDYLPGAKLGVQPKRQPQSQQQDRRVPGGGGSGRPQQRTGGVAASRSTSGGGKSKGGGRSGRQGQGKGR